jgi:POLQ-like helicase
MNYTGELQMKPEKESKKILDITLARVKMIEYNVPEEHQNIKFDKNPAKLFPLVLGLLGDYTYTANQENTTKEKLEELSKNLRFSSRFFDAYLQSNLDNTTDMYLILLGSATYYLCSLPGHSTVLIKKIKEKQLSLEAQGLENLLLWLLRSDVTIEYNENDNSFIHLIERTFYKFITEGENENDITNIINVFRNSIYSNGSARCLLFADIISAIIKYKINNSCWKVLPIYSGIDIDNWKNIIQKKGFIKEFWPAQHLIGEKGILKGKSAIMRMPTSAGKTKANEIIIRSAFLGKRTSLVVIVAPFRALCHEIYNDLYRAFRYENNINVFEIYDVLQLDIPTNQLSENNKIIILTPEKLFYILSHDKETVALSGLFIFDEGHQFDNGSRGITYELLLTNLLLLIQPNSQKILISAVISNVEEISNWLIGENNIVSGKNIISTFRTIGFVSWMYEYGQIYYIKEDNSEEIDFFVPRVIEQKQLNLFSKERTPRLFPEKSDGQAIALYLGLKLVPNGSIAIFCGRKYSVTKICEMLIDIVARGFSLNIPNLIPDVEEIAQLAELYVRNLGSDSLATKSAKLGVFTHHNNIPHGIKVAVEYAMHESLISFIICTSTLAQGVNLPIRYLIISSFNQAGEYIKTRDFHNLIGRAGRAGMHTEGSIIFSEPKIFDQRWYWQKVQELLNPEKSEPCLSKLFALFEPFTGINEEKLINQDILGFVKSYLDKPDSILTFLEKQFHETNQTEFFDNEIIEKQIINKIKLISAIENFMLSNWDELEKIKDENGFSNIVQKTFGYSLADEEMRTQLTELFNIIENNIRIKIVEPEKRIKYGKTQYGINDAIYIEKWVNSNISILQSAITEENLLDIIFDIMKEKYLDKLKLTNSGNLKTVIINWISGISYDKMMDIFSENEIKIKWGERLRKINIDKVVDICDNVFAYNGCILLNAIYEFVVDDIDKNQKLVLLLQKLQRRLKYGLPDETSTIIYELGFSDRVIAQDIKQTLNIFGNDKLEIIYNIKIKSNSAMALISKFPAYYRMKMNNLLN